MPWDPGDAVLVLRDLLLVGAGLFYLLGAAGILRLNDIFSRLHAAAKCSTTAFLMVFLAQLFSPVALALHLKLMLIIAFQAVTVPVATHMIALSIRRLYLAWGGDET